MEDYELNQRLRRRGRVATAPTMAVTSARHWRSVGILRTTGVNQMVIAGCHLAIDHVKLAAFYRGFPPANSKPATMQSCHLPQTIKSL